LCPTWAGTFIKNIHLVTLSHSITIWFRQLVVEAILVLILVVEYSVVPYLGGAIEVERIVRQDHASSA
jgi:hypothetical protein